MYATDYLCCVSYSCADVSEPAVEATDPYTVAAEVSEYADDGYVYYA